MHAGYGGGGGGCATTTTNASSSSSTVLNRPSPITPTGDSDAASSYVPSSLFVSHPSPSSIVPHPVISGGIPQLQSQNQPSPTTATPVKEEIKSHLTTPDGVYRKMTVATYYRPNKATFAATTGINAVPNCPVRVSFVTFPSSAEDEENYTDKICFNIGRELFVFDYVSIHGTPNLSLPIDKRVYKGTFPTCHDFNSQTARVGSVPLVIGFSAGQVQLIDPLQKDVVPSRLFNEDRNIEKTSVTCIKWIPNQPTCFAVSHASGNIYEYNEALSCFSDPPVYQVFKQGDGFTVYSVKTKQQRNPLRRMAIGTGSSAINEFEFCEIPGGTLLLGVVSQDGFLRVIDYNRFECVATMKAYFGGLLCLAFSPDGQLVATGGEDDLLCVYSLAEKRVVCRGQGHKSWISKVAFDPFAVGLSSGDSTCSLDDDDEGSVESVRNIVYTTAAVNEYGCEQAPTATLDRDTPPPPPLLKLPTAAVNGTANSNLNNTNSNLNSNSVTVVSDPPRRPFTGYRIGSVGHDTQLLLWDVAEDVLSNPVFMPTVIHIRPESAQGVMTTSVTSEDDPTVANSNNHSVFNTSKTKQKRHRRGFSFGNRLGLGRLTGGNSHSSSHSSNHANGYANGAESPVSSTTESGTEKESPPIFGSAICPRLDQVPIIEPLVSKKVAHERLTALAFLEECVVTGCQEGYIVTWARPGRTKRRRHHSIGSGKTTTSAVDEMASKC